MARKTTKKSPKKVETLTHEEASRKNIPTAEYESVMEDGARDPIKVAYERRNEDLDPQLVWRGKDVENWSDLVVDAPPLYIQEKVHPKALIDDLVRRSKTPDSGEGEQIDLFADFNGVPDEASRTEFYEHDANWTNRMILGDSLQVMASLAEREGLRGQVQCIYFDPPYGIKFNSNFQWSTTSREVKDGKVDQITREPEQVKAFRDTWRDGVHSYLTYLHDRLTVANQLLSYSGSIFVQISDENLHLVRNLLDEIFGKENFIAQISFRKTSPLSSSYIARINDFVLWYAKDRERVKFRKLYDPKQVGTGSNYARLQFADGTRRTMTSEEKRGAVDLPKDARVFAPDNTRSSGYTESCFYPVSVYGYDYPPQKQSWATHEQGMERLKMAHRLAPTKSLPYFVRFHEDFPVREIESHWTDTRGDMEKTYVVQTASKVVQRCILMTTDPGDLVLDPTCGSGTAAVVAEQWGRRWITVDTSRVALALARARVIGARFPFYLLSDSLAGRTKESELSRQDPVEQPVAGDVRQGFVYERVPHITLRSIANNSEIEVIWENWQQQLEPLRKSLNAEVGESWEEWEIPREPGEGWSPKALEIHEQWWEARTGRQAEIDASIATKADYEHLYDKPYEDSKVVRVSGPFTVESISPHRMVALDELEEDQPARDPGNPAGEGKDFATMVLENLVTAGIQQSRKEDKFDFISVAPWPGKLIAGEGRYREGDKERAPEKRAAIFIGPEFGTVSRADLVEAAKEAGEAGFDVLVSCAFNYEAHASEFDKLGKIPVLKARMNADLHMADDLKNTGKGNLFVIFGEPDIELFEADGEDAEAGQLQVKVNGVDVFDPSSGEVRSDDVDGIACWFVDTDYNEESFFVRQAYFLGANDPYKALKTTLKAEIDEDAWASLNSDVSRPFDKPESGRIAVKVINHLGDEVMKVLRVD